jgi:hypothetical protein
MTIAALIVLLVPTVLVAVGAYLRPDVRRPMLWGGLLAIPVLLAFPLTFHFINFPFGLLRLVTLFMLGALGAAAYEIIFSRFFKLHDRSREPLLWMLVGPFIFLLGVMTTSETVGPLIFALIFEIGLIIAMRRDLLWDVLFSGGAMALFYVLVVVGLVRLLGAPVGYSAIVDTTFSGYTLMGIPIEEIMAVALFGALWGPMYPAFKDLRFRKK